VAQYDAVGAVHPNTKGGRTTKFHVVCDVKGRPLVLLLTPGNVHDCKVAQSCIEAMPPSAELVADKGYDSKALRDWLEERGTTAVITPRKNRKVQYDYDKVIYKQRNIIERMFCRLNVAWLTPALRQTSATAVPSSACFNTNAICASENFDAFMEISFSQAQDRKWKIPAQNGPILREQITTAGIDLDAGSGGGLLFANTHAMQCHLDTYKNLTDLCCV